MDVHHLPRPDIIAQRCTPNHRFHVTAVVNHILNMISITAAKSVKVANSIFVYHVIAQEKDAFIGTALDGLLGQSMNVLHHLEAIHLAKNLPMS